MAITINGGAIKQPTELREWYEDVAGRNVSISGNQQEDYQGKKKRVTMKWDYLSPTDLQALITLFQAGASVTYSNNNSAKATGTFAFTGLAKFEEGEYERGGSNLTKGSEVTIEEASAVS